MWDVLTVSPYMGCLPLYGMSPLIWDVSPYMGCLPLYGMSPLIWDVCPYYGHAHLCVLRPCISHITHDTEGGVSMGTLLGVHQDLSTRQRHLLLHDVGLDVIETVSHDVNIEHFAVQGSVDRVGLMGDYKITRGIIYR